jgi:hypothetical protein
MESVVEERYKQGTVVGFLVEGKVYVANIYRRLCNAYGSSTDGRGTVGRWAKIVTASEI